MLAVAVAAAAAAATARARAEGATGGRGVDIADAVALPQRLIGAHVGGIGIAEADDSEAPLGAAEGGRRGVA